MNFPCLHEANVNTALSISNRKRSAKKENHSVEISSKRFCYSSSTTHRQNFSILKSIIYYMTVTPSSSKGYQQMIQSCKYFFSKNHIIVCSNLIYDGKKTGYKFNVKQDGLMKNIDLKNSQKLWNCINLYRPTLSIISSHIYRGNIKAIRFWDQSVSFNDFVLLASKVRQIFFIHVTVYQKDGSIVPFEKLVEASVNCIEYDFLLHDNDASVSSNTTLNLFRIPHFTNLKKIRLNNVPETFDIENLFIYSKKNKSTEFVLRFSPSISDEYRNRLLAIANEIVEKRTQDFRPPVLIFR